MVRVRLQLALFGLCDANGNGSIDAKELKQALGEYEGGGSAFDWLDGVGSELLSRILPRLPIESTVYIYGLVGGPTPTKVTAVDIISRKLTLRHFSSLEMPTVTDIDRRAAALKHIGSLFDDPLFKTKIGREFPLEQFEEAIAYQGKPGERAVLVA